MKKLLVFGPANSVHLLNWVLPFKETYKDSYQVKILTFHPPAEDFDYKGIEIQYLKSITGTKLDYFFQISRVQKFVEEYKPDIIHAHYASSYGFICTSIPYQCKKILTVWGSDVLVARNNPFLKYLIDRSLKKFNLINVPSRSLSEMLEQMGIPSSRILVFQYGIDLDFFDKFKISKSESGEIQILSSRNWASLYNIELIIDGFKLAYQKNNKLKLVVLGSGNTEENHQVRSKADKHEGIHILGKLSRADLIKELWKSHIFISIPTSDGMSLSVLEALYTECFPILSNIPPNREILENGAGILVENYTPESVGQSILEAVEKFKDADFKKNIAFVDQKANYKKNIAIIESKYREA